MPSPNCHQYGHLSKQKCPLSQQKCPLSPKKSLFSPLPFGTSSAAGSEGACTLNLKHLLYHKLPDNQSHTFQSQWVAFLFVANVEFFFKYLWSRLQYYGTDSTSSNTMEINIALCTSAMQKQFFL